MTVHAAPEYAVKPKGSAPPGYPSEAVPDRFVTAADGSTYEQRREAFIAHILRNPAPNSIRSIWFEVVRMKGGGQPYGGIIHAALDFIDARKDCADFVLHGILRLLFCFLPDEQPDKRISPPLQDRIQQSVLGFKYFPDEPGIDSMCTWTENHYILFTSAAYLAGQRYPDETFLNSSETGREKMARNRERILRWLDLRFRSGFSEWLSHVYYDEDLTALLSLVDYCQDEEIVQRSRMVIDLLLLDMAINSFKGVFGSTHGRSYENTKKWASNEGTTDTGKLLFGKGVYSGYDNMSAAAFALSDYRVPAVIEAIANDNRQAEQINLQRMGIRLEETGRWGIDPVDFENGMQKLTLEAYMHPCTIANTLRMFDTCRWWENDFFKPISAYRGLLRLLRAFRALPLLARFLERDICRNTREEVNIYTYRTPDAMLSTAQDYRKGFGGDQQHIWQATLGPDAVCFTTHPAKIEGVTPNYWSGSGLLPRAAQHENVTIVVYKIERIPALYVPVRHFFTHAWLPRDKFDEMVEKDGWIFARKGDGYLALYSRESYFWNEGGDPEQVFWRVNPEDIGREVIAPGKENIWICQVGCRAVDGEFNDFVTAITAAKLRFEGLNVEYRAPGAGWMHFGWDGPLLVDGAETTLHDYPRYHNPYMHAAFDSQVIDLEFEGLRLALDWKTGQRSVV